MKRWKARAIYKDGIQFFKFEELSELHNFIKKGPPFSELIKIEIFYQLAPSIYAKLHKIKVGTKLRTDGGFTCMKEDEIKEVKQDRKDGLLYIECEDGTHSLDDQLNDNGELIGLYLVE